jgi:hypothetical protein
LTALCRHARGDWGDLLPEDATANDLALGQGDRLFSAHGQGRGRFWVITTADRSLTKVVLPEIRCKIRCRRAPGSPGADVAA